MSAIRVEGFPGWDGTYELSEGDRAFTADEWRLIKQHSGWLRANIAEGFAGEDPDLFIIVAVIAMVRERKVHQDSALKVAAQMSQVPYTDAMITLVPDAAETEDDALPPAFESENGEPSQTDSLSNNDTKTESESSSGTSSEKSSARLAVRQ